MKMIERLLKIPLLLGIACSLPESIHAETPEVPVLIPRMELVAEQADDQDDHCIWISPTDPESSLIICSDKSANRLFTYGLDGELQQTLTVSKPGNIDLRQGVQWGDQTYDVVVVNQREPETMLRVFLVDPNGKLVQVDDQISTGVNYGGCLTYDADQQILSFLSTSKEGEITQYALTLTEAGRVRGELMRSWTIGYCEGAVADDASQTAFIAEEDGTVWKVGTRMEDPTPGERLTEIGEHGLAGDLEGMALLQHERYEDPLLIISDQGRSRFVIVTTSSPAQKVAEFSIEGASDTDGIDLNQTATSAFPKGLFVCHTDKGSKTPLVVDLSEILALIPAETK